MRIEVGKITESAMFLIFKQEDSISRMLKAVDLRQ